MKLVDLVGCVYHHLTVISRAGSDANGHPYWNCLCQCGATRRVLGADLKRKYGAVKSCGCLRSTWSAAVLRTHGLSKSREYGIWSCMLSRCLNSKDKRFADYGGRGIGVCQHWWSFENFYCDMGVCPDGYQIDRVDNDGNYNKKNCRWVSRSENCRNTRNSHFVVFNGLRLNCCEWSARNGFPEWTVANRINRGWSPERAITTPVRIKKRGAK